MRRRTQDLPGFEHERQRIPEFHRCQMLGRRTLDRRGVGTVRGEQAVQRQAAGQKAGGFGVVDAAHQPHAFVHDVSVKPRRAERVFGDHPARREDREVDVGDAGGVRGRGQHGEDRRIGMVEADGVHDHEAREVVFVRRQIAVPRHDIQRRVIQRRRPERAHELLHQFGWLVLVLEPRHWSQKIAGIGQAVGADRPEFGQAQGRPVILADIAAGGAAG